MRRRTGGLVLTLAATLTASAGCAGSDEGPRGDDPAADFSVATALAQLPASEGGLTISVADVAAVREANGLEVPDLSDPQQAGEYAAEMAGGVDEARAMLTPGPARPATSVAETWERLGFSWLEAETMATVVAPPEEFTWTAYAEPVDPAGALEDVGDGILSMDPDDPVRVGVDGSQAVVSRSREDVAAWLGGDAASLAEDEALGAVAAALDDEGAISAYLVRIDAEEPARTLGLGWTVDGGDPGFVVAYDARDADAATDAVDALREDYAQPEVAALFELGDVTADGRVVTVTGAPVEGRVQVLLEMLMTFTLPSSP